MAVAAGYGHNLALKSDGTVVGWGLNYDGEASPPVGLSGVVAIAAGDNHSLAVTSDGLVYAWGGGALLTDEHIVWNGLRKGLVAETEKGSTKNRVRESLARVSKKSRESFAVSR